MKRVFYLLLSLLLLTGCSEDEQATPEENQLAKVFTETESTNAVITLTSIEIKGSVENKGEALLAYGVVWSNNPQPTINDHLIDESRATQAVLLKESSTGTMLSFTTIIDGLIPGENYYFRIFAETEGGVAYGEEINLVTEDLAGTKWDFYFNHFPDEEARNWHGDVEFYEDGTAFYDEPATPGVYATEGTWTLDGDSLTYYLQGDPEATSYILTGKIEGNTMSGTYTFGEEDYKEWTAVKY
ncbi:lipoprotein [Zunongwangia sp. H14]|uniref:lipoprotein n=1 Tax=Zunongwangia sp. H14 TaxID=3240792 RepID=UPI00356658A1